MPPSVADVAPMELASAVVTDGAEADSASVSTLPVDEFALVAVPSVARTRK